MGETGKPKGTETCTSSEDLSISDADRKAKDARLIPCCMKWDRSQRLVVCEGPAADVGQMLGKHSGGDDPDQ